MQDPEAPAANHAAINQSVFDETMITDAGPAPPDLPSFG